MTKAEMSCQQKALCEQARRENTLSTDGLDPERGGVDNY